MDQTRAVRLTDEPYAVTAPPCLAVAVGIPLGRVLPVDAPNEVGGAIRRKSSTLVVEPGTYAIWAAGLDAPELASMPAVAAERGISDAEDRLQELRSAGLIVVLQGTDADVQILDSCRLHLTGIGLGSDPDDPAVSLIVGRRSGRLIVDQVLYSLWATSSMDASLRDTCVAVADAFALAPDEVSSRFLANLGSFMRSGTIFLDAA